MKTIEHVQIVLESFERKYGRKPKTIDEFRLIGETAKLAAVKFAEQDLEEAFENFDESATIWN